MGSAGTTSTTGGGGGEAFWMGRVAVHHQLEQVVVGMFGRRGRYAWRGWWGRNEVGAVPPQCYGMLG